METLPKEIIDYLDALGYEARPVMELLKKIVPVKKVKPVTCKAKVYTRNRKSFSSTSPRACRCVNDGNCFKSQAAASRYYFKTVTYAQNISSICRGKSLKNIHGLKFEYI